MFISRLEIYLFTFYKYMWKKYEVRRCMFFMYNLVSFPPRWLNWVYLGKFSNFFFYVGFIVCVCVCGFVCVCVLESVIMSVSVCVCFCVKCFIFTYLYVCEFVYVYLMCVCVYICVCICVPCSNAMKVLFWRKGISPFYLSLIIHPSFTLNTIRTKFII